MSYPPPPGLEPSKATPSASPFAPQSQSSLPPRPPPPTGSLPSFKPAFSTPPSSASGAPGTGSYSSHGGSNSSTQGFPTPFASFTPRQVNGPASGWQSHSPSVSAPPAPPSGFSAQSVYGGNAGQPSNYQHGQGQQYYQQDAQAPYTATSPPQIRNPFPMPAQEQPMGRGRGTSRFQDPAVDPEMEAQIAQWQSAYAPKDATEQAINRGVGRGLGRISGQGIEGSASASGANAGPLGGRVDPGATSVSHSATDAGPGIVAGTKGADGKEKTVVRSGGGNTWTDASLLEWDPAHFRLFVGNLAGEVTDDSLLKAFARYPSVQKARVVRDKRTTKSKGYGFVSFSDGDEYFQAAREMQGKYIGSHPVLLRRSTTEIRPVAPGHKKGKHGKGGKGGNQGASGGAKTGAGVQRKPNKTKGGLRVLG
ncbi:MAG: hypothetical protein M1816_006391 [Peltula sp. TS41687]|nr:MAG: hypothetical protein M1816_006391 [Peltula sp. TS41687]